METAELTRCFLLCNTEGADVHIHVVGDRSFRTACDAVEAARTELAATADEWRIPVTLAHCELVDPADMLRPAELGIVVNWTTHWSGAYFGEAAKKHLGDERWDRMYRFNEIAERGALLTFSSDVVTSYELHRSNPLFGMQVAATRVDPEYPLSPACIRVALAQSRTPGFPVSCCWLDTRSTAPSNCVWRTRTCGRWISVS
jgi:predicted amidohydrolase YtcJ